MNFELSDDQRDIKRTEREFLAARYPWDEVRRLALEEERGFTDAQWDEMTELGWPELGDLGTVELIVLAEELGYAVAPTPLPSTWASAASSSGVMTSVECLAKSGPYWRHVCDGGFTSEPLTGKKTSAGLRATCTIQFTAAQTVTTKTVPRAIRMTNGAPRKARSARPARRAAVERRARRLRVRVL